MRQEATEQVLDLRGRLDRMRQKVVEYRVQAKAAEDQLAAADDNIKNLDLDPDRDLERQVDRLLADAEKLLTSIEKQLDEVASIIGADAAEAA